MTRGKWDDFFPYVQPWAPSCPESFMRNALREGAIKLCKYAGVLEQDLPALTSTINVATYTPTTNASDEEVDRIVNLLYNGVKVNAATKAYLDQFFPTWQSQAASDIIRYTQDNDSTFDVVYIPLATGTSGNLKIRAKVRPTISAMTVHPDLLSTYSEAISEWAKYRVLSMPPKVARWSDKQGAADAMTAWKRASQNAFWKMQRNNTDTDLVASPASSFGTLHSNPVFGP